MAYVAGLRAPTRPASIARALEGIAVTKESPVTRSPVLRLWKLLDEGTAATAAISAAQSYAGALASTELLVAERGGLGEGGRASGARIAGWRKEPGPTACEWCLTVSSDLYRTPDAVPFHERDSCSVSPEFEEGA
jgi:hypothetical protein